MLRSVERRGEEIYKATSIMCRTNKCAEQPAEIYRRVYGHLVLYFIYLLTITECIICLFNGYLPRRWCVLHCSIAARKTRSNRRVPASGKKQPITQCVSFAYEPSKWSVNVGVRPDTVGDVQCLTHPFTHPFIHSLLLSDEEIMG